MHISVLLFALSPVAQSLVTPQQQLLQESQLSQTVISNVGEASELELVSSERLQGDILAGNLLRRAKRLYKIAELGIEEFDHPTRVIGSKGHLGTLDYIYSTLSSLGDYYELSNQTFNATMGNVRKATLRLGHTTPASADAMSLTPPTPKGGVSGNLVLVTNDGCDASDYPKELAGQIAFVRRGTCPFGDKSILAGRAGALAAVIYNPADDGFGGTLGPYDADKVPTFSLGGKDAKPILDQLKDKDGEPIRAHGFVDGILQDIATINIIAQTRDGDPDNCVMLGGHSDSVAEGPGINDDGTGSLTLLEIATRLANYKVKNCVRFGWWAGEEEGLLGSDYYVSVLTPEENRKIRLFMDYDMLASSNFAYQIYNATNAVNPSGSEELRDLYVDWYKSQGQNFTFIPFDGRSDYDGFIRHGIPGGGIATGAEGIKTKEEEEMFGGKAGDWYDPCYHQSCDLVENLNLYAWEINTKLVAHSVATYALSLDTFPQRTEIVELSEADRNPYGRSGRPVM
ncbi:hypothetical protein F5884DRAFT_826251 [Xylogone sp. PMI_703]|nr:hypothetical protein F5884DRAFT_826251 [Xylogone sp. PMI_703]